MQNRRYAPGRIPATAALDRTAGVPCFDNGVAGIPVTSAKAGALYSLDTELGGKALDATAAALSGVGRGQIIHINKATSALTFTDQGTAGGAGTVPFGVVTHLPLDQPGVPAGELWVTVFGPRA